MTTLEIICLVMAIGAWVFIASCIIWVSLPDREKKPNKVKLRKSKNYYIGRLEALETFMSISKEIQKRWGYAYIHFLGLKSNNKLQTKKQWKIRNSEAYKLGWEDFANLKMKNIPDLCRRYCAQPKYDFYCLGDCRGCRSYNGSQDILWRIHGQGKKQNSEEMQKIIKYVFALNHGHQERWWDV